MERIEIYKISDGSLCVEIYKNMNDENSVMYFKGEKAIKAIQTLGKEKIRDVIETPKTDELVLIYKQSIVRLNEYTEIMYKEGIRELRKNIKKFKETQALKKIKIKKVTRKKKHTGKVIIPISIVAIIALSSSLAGYDNDKNLNNNLNESHVEPTTIAQLLEENTVTPYEEEFIMEEGIRPQYVETESEETMETTVSIAYEDNTETEKAYYARNNYWDLIEKYSQMYGLDPSLVLAIATQEKGFHSATMDEGGATGLMQIQNEVWDYEEKTSYNFEIGGYETIYITPEKIQDLEQNIRIGCTIFQESLQVMDYNIIAAIQCYNMGQGNMDDILNAYSIDCGRNVDEILANPNDLGWLDYRYIPECGDPEYVEHVLSWIGNGVNVTVLKDTGEQVSLNIQNNINQKNQVIC